MFAAAHGSPTEEDCLRFLRAREFNKPNALEMLRRTHTWRMLNGVDSLLSKEPEDPHEAVFQAICPHLNQGYDLQGFPIYIERTGRVDVHKYIPSIRLLSIAHRACQVDLGAFL